MTAIDSSEETDPGTPRRRFLRRIVGLILTAISVVLAAPLVVFGIVPGLRRPARQWIELGPVDDIGVGKPTAFTYRFHRFDGYLDTLVRGTVYVTTKDRQRFTVLSNVCPHGSCGVRWEEGEKRFFCPCHNGVFNADGKVVSGPPPRPLDQLPHKVERGRIFIEMKEA